MLYFRSFILVSLVSLASSTSTCGSLITYRQYSDILEHAPPCFRQGCSLGNRSSLSSNCSTGHPCSELWTSISRHASLDWCASPSCSDDRACRTHSWPIINSTRLCQSQPDDWMYISGDCCASGNEPFDIARWIKKHCTQEWRANFAYFDGMARDDWLEYILPWNWTIHYDNSTGNVKSPPRCHRPSYYLKLYALESVAVSLAVISMPFVQLLFHYSDEWKINLPLLRSLNDSALKRVKTFITLVKIGWSEHAKYYLLWPLIKLWELFTCKLRRKDSSEESSTTLDVLQALAMAFIWAGLSTGITIFNAFHLKAAPGFEHVHSWRLALLWFARPNFSWITCGIGLFNREWLVDVLEKKSGRENDVYVVELFTKVAYSAAISELLMELLGFYSLIRTTRIGHIREFYISHHLYHFYRGHAARRMYNGALVWTITMPVLFIFWILAIWKFATLIRKLAETTAKSPEDKADGKQNRKEFWHSVGVTLFGWTRKKKAPDSVQPPKQLPTFRPVKVKRKDSSFHPYRPPNAVQRFIIKYIIRGHVRKCLGAIIPEGRLRVWIRRHLLRTSLGDAPQRSLSRTRSIHAHIDGSDSSGLLYHQEGLSAHPGLEMSSIPRTDHNEDTRRIPAVDVIDPATPPRDVLSSSSHVTYAYSADPYSKTAPESDPFLSPDEHAETTSRPSDLHPRSLRPGSSMRRRPNPVQDYSTYDTVPIDETPDSFFSGARTALMQQPNPQNPFADTISVASARSETQLGGVILPQRTSYVHEMPLVKDTFDRRQPKSVADEEEGLKGWLQRRIKKADERKERQKELNVWQKDTIRHRWMWLALGLGLISYVCQWVFWDGFVNVAGDK